MRQETNDLYNKQRLLLVLGFLGLLSVVVFIIAGQFDFLEWFVSFSRTHENWELDEIFAVCIFWILMLAVVSYVLFRKAKSRHAALVEANDKLQGAMAEIKQLRGIIPICANCKKIRDEKGDWQQVEVYVRDHSQADFSHGLCPECITRLYPDLKIEQKDNHQ